MAAAQKAIEEGKKMDMKTVSTRFGADLAKDLCGSVKGAPRDLSTNRKYLEGFGR